MGCALDLLENPKARSHILEWRSVVNESRGIAHLLIDMWNEEEQMLCGRNVCRGVNGIFVTLT